MNGQVRLGLSVLDIEDLGYFLIFTNGIFANLELRDFLLCSYRYCIFLFTQNSLCALGLKRFVIMFAQKLRREL